MSQRLNKNTRSLKKNKRNFGVNWRHVYYLNGWHLLFFFFNLKRLSACIIWFTLKQVRLAFLVCMVGGTLIPQWNLLLCLSKIHFPSLSSQKQLSPTISPVVWAMLTPPCYRGGHVTLSDQSEHHTSLGYRMAKPPNQRQWVSIHGLLLEPLRSLLFPLDRL